MTEQQRHDHTQNGAGLTSNDIVTRLRRVTARPIDLIIDPPPHPLCVEAADEIERLRQRLWDCAIIAGADTDGNTTYHALAHPDIADFAYKAVLQLAEDYDMLPGESEAMKWQTLAKENFRLTSLIEEIIPYLLNDIKCALQMGPIPEGHDNDNCEDCRWYKRAIAWKQRIDAGEIPGVTYE